MFGSELFEAVAQFLSAGQEALSARQGVLPQVPENAPMEVSGPSHQPYIVKNASLENSLKNRIFKLERDHTPLYTG